MNGSASTFSRTKNKVELCTVTYAVKKQRRKLYGSYNRRGQLIDRVSIDERPAIVDSRSRIGDWELDTIIGKNHKQAIISLIEQKSRYTGIQKVNAKIPRASLMLLSNCYHHSLNRCIP